MTGPHLAFLPAPTSAGARELSRPCVPPTPTPHPSRYVLVTGASGYIGGRLVPHLLAAGHRVRVSSRNIEKLRAFSWAADVDMVEADLEDRASLTRACRGIDVVVYLVHSMREEADFGDSEARTATNLAQAATAANVEQIVYLSGLVPEMVATKLSPHMRSRTRVGEILLAGKTPALVLRAGVIIGSGSASFEMIRHLSERLPMMVAPKWITNRVEPLSICDALYYLTAACGLVSAKRGSYDIGCGRTYEFRDLLAKYAQLRGLHREIVVLPFPPIPALGWWVGLITPIPHRLAFPLSQSMSEDAICRDHAIAEIIPDPPGGRLGYLAAVTRALIKDHQGAVPTSWVDEEPRASDPAAGLPTDPTWSGQSHFEDVQVRETSLRAWQVWPLIEAIGGPHGWYSTPYLWRIRGFFDRLVGGPGLLGRRHPDYLRLGDRLDWWRVTEIVAPSRLTLHAEMRVKGHAWLQLQLDELPTGGCRYLQRASYVPTGLGGRIYWHVLAPFHRMIFPTMADQLIATAEQRAATR